MPREAAVLRGPGAMPLAVALTEGLDEAAARSKTDRLAGRCPLEGRVGRHGALC